MRLIHRAWPGFVLGLVLAAFPAPASAAPVHVIGHGRSYVENDRFLPADAMPPPPGGRATARTAAKKKPKPPRVRPGATRTALKALLASGQIDQAEYQKRLDTYNAAVSARNDLRGRSRKELEWVIGNTDEMSQHGLLTVARLEPVFLVLDRNRDYWSSTGPLPADGDRIRFDGSLVIFQYYPGEGVQLQELANWGKVNGYLNGGYPQVAKSLLDELIPLGVNRDGGVAWEYYFHFGGGAPPWTSSLSQGTAVQALVHAAKTLGVPEYRSLAVRGLRLFQMAPPAGVRTPMGHGGVHYVIYSFAPRYFVLNAFIQALNGLFDVGSPEFGDSAKARTLFRAGDREARREVPRFDTGKWSRYSLSGELSTLSYHVLLRDFLQGLCDRTGTNVYCKYARKFTRYLR